MPQPLTIIGSFVSPYVRKVLACLALKGLDYEIDPITPFFGNDEYERMSPLRRIPVLIDGDISICDFSVICAYLDDAYPERPLLPADPKDRARARWLEEFADTRLGDIFIWSLFYQRVVRRLVWGEETDEERVAKTLAEDVPQALDYLENLRFSADDIDWLKRSGRFSAPIRRSGSALATWPRSKHSSSGFTPPSRIAWAARRMSPNGLGKTMSKTKAFRFSEYFE